MFRFAKCMRNFHLNNLQNTKKQRIGMSAQRNKSSIKKDFNEKNSLAGGI